MIVIYLIDINKDYCPKRPLRDSRYCCNTGIKNQLKKPVQITERARKKGRIPDEAGRIKALKMHVMIQAMTKGKKAGRRVGT